MMMGGNWAEKMSLVLPANMAIVAGDNGESGDTGDHGA